jgi:hypothetical protein
MGKIVRCLGNQELVPDASLQILQSEKVILPAGFAGRRSAAAQAHTAASPDLSQGLMAAAGGRGGRFLDLDFRVWV